VDRSATSNLIVSQSLKQLPSALIAILANSQTRGLADRWFSGAVIVAGLVCSSTVRRQIGECTSWNMRNFEQKPGDDA
jgi:hypothetical protein